MKKLFFSLLVLLSVSVWAEEIRFEGIIDNRVYVFDTHNASISMYEHIRATYRYSYSIDILREPDKFRREVIAGGIKSADVSRLTTIYNRSSFKGMYWMGWYWPDLSD